MASSSQINLGTRSAHVCTRSAQAHYASPIKLISSRMYEPSFAKTTSGCPNHGLACENVPQIHNLDSLLDYDQEENERFVKEVQENLVLMDDVGGCDDDGGFETLPYIDFNPGELNNNEVLDDIYFPPMLKYIYMPLRKMSRRTGLILDLAHESQFTKPQFVGTRFNINGLRLLEHSAKRCEYKMHFGDVRDVGIHTDQDIPVVKMPLQYRENSVYELSESEFINEHGVFYEGINATSDELCSSKEEEEEEVSEEVKKMVNKFVARSLKKEHVKSELNNDLKNVIFDCVDDEMVSYGYVCSKWRFPGYLWVEVPPQDVLVEFGCSNRPFVTDQYFCLTSSADIMSENDDIDDCEWQCSKLLHRVGWKKAIDSRMDLFNDFMDYAYGKDEKHVLKIVRDNRQLDIDNAFYVDACLTSSKTFSEKLNVRKEYYDQWEYIWSDHKTNPFLKGVDFDDEDDDDVDDEDVVVKLPRTSSSRIAEIKDELNDLSEVGHGWGYAWAFAMNQMLVAVTSSAAMVDTLMRCRKEDNFCQTMNATEYVHNSIWLSNTNLNRKNYLGQSAYASTIRTTEYINKLENGENGVVYLNSAVNTMLDEKDRRRRRMSFSYLKRLVCASEMMVNPLLWDEQCARIWDVKFSDIIERSPPKLDKEKAVFQSGFFIDRHPSVRAPIANMFGTKYVVGCAIIERPFHHLEPSLSEDKASVALGYRDSVFGIDRLYMDYPTDSPTNDAIVFGVDATFKKKTAADLVYHNDSIDNSIQYIQEEVMKAYSSEQKETSTINGIFRHMFSTTLKAICMGVLIKEKEILRHYYSLLVEEEIKQWYKKHHQSVMMRQKSKFLKEHSRHRSQVFSSNDNDNVFFKMLHIEDVKRNLIDCLFAILDNDMEDNLQCDIEQMPNHPSYQTVSKSRMNTEKLVLHLASLSNDKNYFIKTYKCIYRCKCFMEEQKEH